MTFNEKSAWIMIAALLVAGAGYASSMVAVSNFAGGLVAPIPPLFFVFTGIIVAIAILGHTVVALWRPQEANQALDERERMVAYKAGHWSGNIMGFGIVSALVTHLVLFDSSLLFHMVLASLFVAQVGEYILTIALTRRAS